MTFDVVVLSGGRARRLGRDKASTIINGATMMERVLSGIPDDLRVIVVGGYPDRLKREVILTREEPQGAGPLAALGAGLAHVKSANFLLLATDMPFVGNLGPRLLAALEKSSSEIDAVLPVDERNQLQPLCAAYRTDSIRKALAHIGDLTNGSMKQLIAQLRFQEFVQQDAWELSDVDTPENLENARSHAHRIEGVGIMDEWIVDVKAALGLDVDVDIDLLLEVARDAAHNVTRPAAPITTYLLGIAVANGQDAKSAAARIQQLALSRIQP